MTTYWDFIGPKADAEEIKAKLAKFLRETLGLELNQQKTLITDARSQHARFLGYSTISPSQHSRDKITGGRRTVNGTIALRVPRDVIKAQTARCPPDGGGNPRTAPGSRTSTTTTSSGNTEPNTRASSTTTCLPGTSTG